MIRPLLAISKTTLLEQVRSRVYLVILFFGAIMISFSVLLSALAPGHQSRVLFDFGLLLMEIFGLLTAVFGVVTFIHQDLENRSIYLVLSRPIPRYLYLLGRFSGLMFSVIFLMIVMACIHVFVLMVLPGDFFLDGGLPFWAIYPTLVLMSICKLMMTAAFALFFTLFATSPASALVFTFIFWITGHFLPEMAFLIREKIPQSLIPVSELLMHIFPNFQVLNYRDLPNALMFPGYNEFLGSLIYTVGYVMVLLSISAGRFSRKEF